MIVSAAILLRGVAYPFTVKIAVTSYVCRAPTLNVIIKVDWGRQPQKNYRVKIALDTYDRSGLLLDITKTVDRLGLHIASMTSDEKTRRKKSMNSSHILLALDVPSLDQLSAVLSQLNQIPNVVSS